jgi:gas vesicle protein
LSQAQNVLNKNVKRANKNLKNAQKNLKKAQGTVQDSVQSGLGVAQNVLGKSTESATKGLKKVTGSVKDMQDGLHDRAERNQRRRARAKFLFRLGLVAGVVFILLYAPRPGYETRRQLGDLWQQLSQRSKELLGSFTS